MPYDLATGPRGGGVGSTPATTSTYGANVPFSLNAPPQAGAGTFGAVPAPMGLPDPFGDIAKIFPNLGQANNLLSQNVISGLGGVISPGTMNALKLANAQFGQGSGMGPLAGLTSNQLFGNIAGFSEGLQSKAAQELGSGIGTIASAEVVNPALQAAIARQNLDLAAAPNPQLNAQYLEQLFREMAGGGKLPGGLNFAPSPAGGTRPPTATGTTSAPGVVVGGGTGPAYDPSKFDWYSSTFGPRGAGGGAGGADTALWDAMLSVPSGGTSTGTSYPAPVGGAAGPQTIDEFLAQLSGTSPAAPYGAPVGPANTGPQGIDQFLADLYGTPAGGPGDYAGILGDGGA